MPRKIEIGRAGSAFSNCEQESIAEAARGGGVTVQEGDLTILSNTRVEHKPNTMAPNVVTTTVMLVDAALRYE